MKKIILCLSVFLFTPVADAREIADVKFEETTHIPGVGNTLALNGLGIRYKFFFKIYIAALYLQEKSRDVKSVVETDAPKRMTMHFLYEEVEKEKLVDGWNEGFENNLSSEKLNSLKSRIDQFNSYFESMKSGEVIYLDYLPGKGTRVIIKGTEKGIVEGLDFNQALLSIWLGDEPVGEELKQQLLGVEVD